MYADSCTELLRGWIEIGEKEMKKIEPTKQSQK